GNIVGPSPRPLDVGQVRQYLTRMRTSLSSKGQVVLPAEFREQDDLQPGQQFEVSRVKAGEYRLKRVSAKSKPGLVDLLLACPVKNWYQRIPSESTADIAKRLSLE